MTDPLVSAEVAKDILAKDAPASDGVLVQWSAVRSLARTVVAQNDQIDTLSRLLARAEQAAIERAEQIGRLQKAIRRMDEHTIPAEDIIRTGVLKTEDMEGTDE